MALTICDLSLQRFDQGRVSNPRVTLITNGSGHFGVSDWAQMNFGRDTCERQAWSEIHDRNELGEFAQDVALPLGM